MPRLGELRRNDGDDGLGGELEDRIVRRGGENLVKAMEVVEEVDAGGGRLRRRPRFRLGDILLELIEPGTACVLLPGKAQEHELDAESRFEELFDGHLTQAEHVLEGAGNRPAVHFLDERTAVPPPLDSVRSPAIRAATTLRAVPCDSR